MRDRDQGLTQILLLEDDLDLGMRLTRELEKAGYAVWAFTNVTDALDYIDRNDVDLVIADVMIRVDGRLTADGGVKLTSKIKQIMHHAAPVIAISGSFERSNNIGGNAIENTLKTVGARYTLAKPFEMSELLQLINKALLPAQYR